jgi:hypothetical protein
VIGTALSSRFDPDVQGSYDFDGGMQNNHVDSSPNRSRWYVLLILTV